MSLTKVHSKQSLTPYNGRTGTKRKYSKAHHTMDMDELTNMFMPLYEYSFKGLGHNNAVWHTMKDFRNITVATTGLDPKGGDFSAIQCLPGRQVYMEFSGLALTNPFYISTAASGRHPSTDTFRNGYNCGNTSLLDLMERCLMHNNFFPNSANTVQNSSENMNAAFANTLSGIRNLWATNNITISNTTDADSWLMSRICDLEVFYEGGFQSHKFTNTTSLPVYMEILEYMPRQPLGFTQIYGDFAVAGQNGMAWAFPGLRETITADKVMQWQKQNGLDPTNYPDSKTLFDDYDDKQFKYNKFMKITNNRWVIGHPIHHRILPGETFTYTMEFPPFRLKFAELIEWRNLYMNTGQNSQPQFYEGSVTSGTNVGPSFFPKFSKFCSIRVTGSTAWTQGAPSTGGAIIGQKDSMDDGGGQTSMNFGVTDDDPAPNKFANIGVKTATHSVQLLHSMNEKHSLRMRNVYSAYHREVNDYTPNARDKSSITAADNMGFYDESIGTMDVVAGDTV